MLKKAIIKAVLITFGAMLLLTSALSYIMLKSKIIEQSERRVRVCVASRNIRKGDIISEDMLEEKLIRVTDSTGGMVSSPSDAKGRVAVSDIRTGDYIRKYELADADIGNDERITVVGAEFPERLANLIKKGSRIDVRLKIRGERTYLLFSGLNVDDVRDELGPVTPENAGSKRVYLQLKLSREQLEKLYAARDTGDIVYELYQNDAQTSDEQEINLEDIFNLQRNMRKEVQAE